MATGAFGSFDLTTGTKISMDELIRLIDPFDAPLHGMYDMDGRPAIRKGTSYQIREDWMDDTLQNPRTTASAAATTSETVVTVTDRLAFTTDDVFLTPNAEYVRITGYGTTANTLLLSRGFGSSTSASIASSAVLVGVGTVLPEGSDPNDGRWVDRSGRFNYNQIFGPYKIKVSETEQVIDKYGIGSTEMDYQIAKHIKQFAVQMEQSLLYGVRTIDTTNKRRSMGGMINYISTNVDSTTTDITESALRTQLQAVYDAGGRATWVAAGSTQKGKISQFSTSLMLLDRSDRTRGQVVDYFECDFATVMIMLDRWVRKQDLFIFDADQPEELTLRELQFKALGDTGDSRIGELVAEKTMRFHRQSHAARFSALT